MTACSDSPAVFPRRWWWCSISSITSSRYLFLRLMFICRVVVLLLSRADPQTTHYSYSRTGSCLERHQEVMTDIRNGMNKFCDIFSCNSCSFVCICFLSWLRNEKTSPAVKTLFTKSNSGRESMTSRSLSWVVKRVHVLTWHSRSFLDIIIIACQIMLCRSLITPQITKKTVHRPFALTSNSYGRSAKNSFILNEKRWRDWICLDVNSTRKDQWSLNEDYCIMELPDRLTLKTRTPLNIERDVSRLILKRKRGTIKKKMSKRTFFFSFVVSCLRRSLVIQSSLCCSNTCSVPLYQFLSSFSWKNIFFSFFSRRQISARAKWEKKTNIKGIMKEDTRRGSRSTLNCSIPPRKDACME